MHADVLEYLLFLNLHSHILYSRMHGDTGTMLIAFMLAKKDQLFNQVCFQGPQWLLREFLFSENIYPTACSLMHIATDLRYCQLMELVDWQIEEELRAKDCSACLCLWTALLAKFLMGTSVAGSLGTSHGSGGRNGAAAGTR